MFKPFVNWLILGGIAAALVNCGGGHKEPESAPPSMQASTVETEPQMTPAARATPMPAEPAASPPETNTAPDTWPGATEEAAAPATPMAEALTAEQIAAITNAANDAEVAQARVAQKNAKNPKVKKFAQMMITDHSQAKAKQKKLMTKLGLTPVDSTLSTQLKTDSEQKVEDLKALKGPDFDRAYMDAQVDAHQKVLDAFDSQLIPNAKDPEYKALLTETRAKVAAHLEMAKEIQQSLLDSGAKSAPSGNESMPGKGSMPNDQGMSPSGSQKPGPSDMGPHQH